jgi:acyl-CoA synthetase (NDP forming)
VTPEDRTGAEPDEGARVDFDLRPLYAPASVAIVGASPRGDLATTIRDNIRRVGGPASVYFVNPNYQVIDGTPCHPDLASLPEVPDTVVLAVNPLRAAGFTRQAAEAGVPAVIIPGGGVVEGGVAAARMQAEVAAIARAHGTTILGPNCMGLIDLTSGCATYIDEIHPFLRRGRVAGISQSGSVADTFVHSGTRIGWSRIVSSGSEVVIDLCDHLAYSLEDPETEAVVLFLEGIRRPERFLALADRALALGKPILAVKVGRSRQARAAAVAHTGALAGEDRAAEAAFRAVGVVRFDDLDDLLEAAALVDGMFASGRTVGRGRTAVVTVSTGEGSLVADLAVRTGLDLPPVPEIARAAMAADMPTLGYIGNPMDPWGAAEATPAYRSCFTALADSGAYDVLALVHDFPFRSTQGELDLALELGGVLMAATSDRLAVLPVFVSLTSGDPSPEIRWRSRPPAARPSCAVRPRPSGPSPGWLVGRRAAPGAWPTGRSAPSGWPWRPACRATGATPPPPGRRRTTSRPRRLTSRRRPSRRSPARRPVFALRRRCQSGSRSRPSVRLASRS